MCLKYTSWFDLLNLKNNVYMRGEGRTTLNAVRGLGVHIGGGVKWMWEVWYRVPGWDVW